MHRFKFTSHGYLKRNITVFALSSKGKARATRYHLSDQAFLLMPLNLETYFAMDVDERQVQTSFNFALIRQQLPSVTLFTDEEMNRLQELQAEFRQHVSEMTENEYRKEMERLGIDLSWKSSQIEGYTYSLLETERLLRESKTASDCIINCLYKYHSLEYHS